MQLRHLEYFVALGRERHFGRAAESCHITQSTLSAALRQLEDELGVPLIERDRRFRELTVEGRTLFRWAQRILDERASLDQAIGALRQQLAGRLRLGVIPVVLPVVALVTTPLLEAHPGLSVSVHSRTSIDIQRGLDEFQLDGGITYLDNEPLHGVRSVPLYHERYVLLTPADGPLAGKASVAWADAAAVPLCLLTGDMQNRRILNGIFEEAGVHVRPRMEANTVMALCSHLRTGGWSSILPHSFLWLFGSLPGIAAIPLTDPVRTRSIGLVFRDQTPLPPLVTALERTAQSLDLQRRIDGHAGF